jgi:Rrf2 family protein
MLSRSSLHALRALTQLARLEPGTFLGASRLGQSIGAPQNYLGKLLQVLAQQGLVESRLGLGGGYSLARSADDISLFDVVDPIDHVSRWNNCFLGHPVCSDQSACAVHERWAQLRDHYLSFLRQTTIAGIAQSGEPLTLPPNPGASQ